MAKIILESYPQSFQMQSEGEQLKYAIRGKGMTIEDAALKLGMSRQQFGYHLQKARLGTEIKQKAKIILGIDIEDSVEIAHETAIAYVANDSKENYSQDQLIYYGNYILIYPTVQFSYLISGLHFFTRSRLLKVLH